MNKLLIQIAVVVALVTALFFTTRSLIKSNNELSNMRTSYEMMSDSVRQRKINDSTVVYYVPTKDVTLDNARVLYEAELRDFKLQTGRSIKNLETFLKTSVIGSNTYVFNNIDSSHCDSLFLSHKDKYSDLTVLVKDGVAIVNNKNYTYLTKYTYKVRNKATWYKPWKWGKHNLSEIKSENPKDSITYINEVFIKK